MVRDRWIECPITDVLLPNGIKIGPFGSQLKKETLISYGQYKVYGQENVYEKDFSLGDRYLEKEHFDKLSSCEIVPGDFVMSTMGTIGKCAIVPKGINRGIMDSHLVRLRFDTRKILPEYLLHLFSDDFCYLKQQTSRLSVGGIMDGLSVGIVSSLEVSFPESKEEQLKIISVLSEMDELIYVLEKEIEKKKNIKTGVMQRYLSGDERLPGFTSKWDIQSIDELCVLVTKQTGFDYSAEIKPSLVQVNYNSTLPFLQNKDFEGYKINFDTDFYIPISVAYKYPKILLDEVCLLISISGRIGNVALFNNNRTAFVGGAVGVAKFKNPDLVEWAMLYLLSPNGQKMIFENEKAGAQHNLTVEDVRNFSIPIPEKDERIAITSMMADIEKDICQLEEKLDKYKNLKAGMMNDLLTGKIRLV